MIFDRRLLSKRRDRAAAQFAQYDFLKRDACARLADRLDDITRSFPVALDLGCHGGQMAEALQGSGKVERLVQADISSAMLAHTSGARVVCDEEWLPFAENSFDAVFSTFALQHVNDLVGCLAQIRRILKPDGLFLCIIPGAHSLYELRSAFAAVESLRSGLSPRIAPFVEVRDAGALLQRAGFALPVVDSDRLNISYPHAFKLMQELRGMGESNLLLERARHLTAPSLMAEMAAYYAAHFPAAEDASRINATIEWVTLTGWKPHPSQQQPAARGSGQVNLNQLLN